MLFTEFRKYFFRLYNAAISSLTTRVANLEVSSTNPKVYRALLSQSGTDAPTAIVLENTLGGVPTLAFNENDSWVEITLSGAFPENKVWFNILQIAGSDVYFTMYWIDNNTVVAVRSSEAVPLEKTPIEILVYE